MNLNSIITRITLIFISAIILLVGVFYFYLNYEEEQKYAQVSSYYENLSKYLFINRKNKNETISYFETLNFEIVNDPDKIIMEGKVLIAKRGFETIVFKNDFYFHVITPSFKIIFKDLSKYKNNSNSYIIFPLFLILLIVIYIWLLKSLYPLKELKNNIKKFSEGDLNIDCRSNKKDEIAQVSNEFDNSVKKIELLLESRQLFLRTIMHELKTPIAKGRIVSELVEDEKQKDRMITIFERLDFLINDFGKVEEVISKNYKPRNHDYLIKDIVKNSISMLILDNKNDKIDLEINENIKINVDFELMSMVYKNLIDNALKYSDDKKVKIVQNKKSIKFISKGKKLEKPFEEYFKPFHNTTKSKTHGMGLGLYIVKSILDIHKMNFEYRFDNGLNIFEISQS